MTSPQHKSYLSALCFVLTGLSYYLLLFTNAGNFYHGGGPGDWLFLNVCMVLGAYFCLQVVRSSRPLPARVVAGVLGVPLACFVLASLWYAATRR